MLSSLATAAESVSIKQHFRLGDLNAVDLIYATSVPLLPILALMTVPSWRPANILVLTSQGDHNLTNTLVLIFCSAILNCFLWLAAFEQIRVTSPITHMISTAARGILQAVLAVAILSQEQWSRTRVISLTTVLMGTALYVSVSTMM